MTALSFIPRFDGVSATASPCSLAEFVCEFFNGLAAFPHDTARLAEHVHIFRARVVVEDVFDFQNSHSASVDHVAPLSGTAHRAGTGEGE